jgi:predicted TPR repeat methyltransferase
MGTVLQAQGKLEEAIEAYNKALSINLYYADAYYNKGNALKDQGKLEEAMVAYNKALSIEPSYGSARHMLSTLAGNTTEKAPREYVENLFDGYAKKFEASLVDKLEYKTPKLIKDMIIKSDHNASLGSVLDLGCGTGLFGLEINSYCSKLEGIDVSKKMLKVADRKNVYDKLSQSDIVEYLSSKPLDFDYYVAADVFVYIGNLSELFQLIKSRNKRPGKFIFSTEHTEKDGYHLLETGRYAHSKSYVEGLCQRFDYGISHFFNYNLRKEKGKFIEGGLYILSFTTE